MVPTDGVSGKAETGEVPVLEPGGADRPTTRAEAATWWELQDELSEQMLGLRDGLAEPETGVDDYLLTEPGQAASGVRSRACADALTAEVLLDGLAAARAAPDRHLADDSRGLLPPGERVALWRLRRSMSQKAVAYRLNRALAWVIAVEQDLDRLDTIEDARDVADLLRIDLQLLMGRDAQGPPDPGFVDEDTVERLHATLEVTGDPVRLFPARSAPVSLAELAVTVRAAWRTYQHAEYARLMRTVPRLLRDAATSDGARGGDPDAAEAARLLSQTYQIAAMVLVKAGLYELARLAADRAFEAAKRGEDDLLLGAAAGCGATVLTSLGRAASALELSVLAAGRIKAAELTGPGPTSVRGALLGQGAVAAARIGDAGRAYALLADADELAGTVAADANRYGTGFNRTSVRMRRVAIAVELGESLRSIGADLALDTADLAAVTPGQRATHQVTLARAHLQAGEVDRAGEALLACEAPDEVRLPVGRAVVGDVLRHARRRGSPLTPRLEQLREDQSTRSSFSSKIQPSS
ncbi:transcriptional regulator [Actinoplanes ianthinogenes]|nr:transcriptional regulator [Actinoplanes ianthinogenes]